MKPSAGAIRYCIVLSVFYLALTLLLPANTAAMQRYSLSTGEYHELLFLLSLPLVAIWFAAFYGYGKLSQYGHQVAKSAETRHFLVLARGCKWLAWSFPITTICSILFNAITNDHPGFEGADAIIITYLTLGISVAALLFISNASRGLLDHAKVRLTARGIKYSMVAFVVISVTYCFATFRNTNLRIVTATNNPYHLPTWLLVFTVIMPYLFAWFAGLLATYELASFGFHSDGIIYRKALLLLALGVIFVIAGSISLQYVTSAIPRTSHLTLNAILTISYIVRIVAAAGYICIAAGSRRLLRIEEV